MKAREICAQIFGLIIRLLGVVFLYRAAETVPMVWNMVSVGFSHNWANILYSLFMVAWQVALACWLLKGAPPVMDWAYPNVKQQE